MREAWAKKLRLLCFPVEATPAIELESLCRFADAACLAFDGEDSLVNLHKVLKNERFQRYKWAEKKSGLFPGAADQFLNTAVAEKLKIPTIINTWNHWKGPCALLLNLSWNLTKCPEFATFLLLDCYLRPEGKTRFSRRFPSEVQIPKTAVLAAQDQHSTNQTHHP